MRDPKIYTDSYRLSILLFSRTKSFSKALRPNLGGQIERLSIKLLMALRRALTSAPHNRVKYLQQSSRLLDDLKILSQMAFDLKAFSPGLYKEVSSHLSEVGKELGGLIKYETNHAPK